jgi:hypothetical protein
VGIQGVILEHHRDVAILGGNVVDEFAVDVEFALGDVLEAGDHAERRGFSAARGTDEDDKFLVVYGDVGVLDGAYVALVNLADLLEFYLGHDSSCGDLC